MSLAKVHLHPELDFVEMLRNPTRSTEVKVWIKKNPDWFLKWRGEQGECALHWAVYMDLAVVLELMQIGLDLNQTDDDAATPLDWVHIRLSLAIEQKIPGITSYNIKKIKAQADRILPELMGLGAQLQYFKEAEVVLEWTQCGLWSPLEVLCHPYQDRQGQPDLGHPFWENMAPHRLVEWKKIMEDDEYRVRWNQAFNRSPLTDLKLSWLTRWPFAHQGPALRDLAWEDYVSHPDHVEASEWVQHLILTQERLAEEELIELGLTGGEVVESESTQAPGLYANWPSDRWRFWNLVWRHQAGMPLKTKESPH